MPSVITACYKAAPDAPSNLQTPVISKTGVAPKAVQQRVLRERKASRQSRYVNRPDGMPQLIMPTSTTSRPFDQVTLPRVKGFYE